MRDFHEMTVVDLKAWLEENGEQAFRAKQIFEWVYGRGVVDWHSMSDLGKGLRDRLAVGFHLRVLQEKEREEEGDVTSVTWGLRDGKATQSVLYGTRREAVISTQVGCPVRCTFCGSGKESIRNLRAAEMLQQVLFLNQRVREKSGHKLSLVSFAGMGEPFKNTEHVLQTIEKVAHSDILGLPLDQIWVSTVGIPAGIAELAQRRLMVRLIVGLHAPNQALRSRLIPVANKNPLDEVIAAAEAYWQQTNLPIIFDYVMLEGVNDSVDQAHELAHLLKRLKCTVRLIPYHEVRGLRFQPSSKKAIKGFRTILYGSGIDNEVFEDSALRVDAALGQLDRFK